MPLHAEDFLPPAALAKLIAKLPRQKDRPLPRACRTEEEEQIALFDWARSQEHVYPCLRLLYAIPNGGYRKKFEATRLAKAGVRAGMPDIGFSVARKGAHSLFLEMKAQDGTISPLQLERAVALVEAGSMVVFCFGEKEARDCLLWYLAGK